MGYILHPPLHSRLHLTLMATRRATFSPHAFTEAYTMAVPRCAGAGAHGSMDLYFRTGSGERFGGSPISLGPTLSSCSRVQVSKTLCTVSSSLPH